MHPWSLISPASRGIGFALARKILQTTNAPVVVTARKDLAQTKKELLEGTNIDEGRLTVLGLDVLDESSIKDAAASCEERFPRKSHQLQLAFIVPGLLFVEKSPAQIDADNALMTFQTNTIGPMLMLKHFSPFLPKENDKFSKPVLANKKVNAVQNDDRVFEGLPSISTTAVMSARVGSITDNRLGGWYSYRASKAAVNQVVKTFDNYLQVRSGEKAMAITLHPGTVKTGLSKEFWGNVEKEKLFERDFAAERLIDVVKGLGVDGRGKCWDWAGKEVPP